MPSSMPKFRSTKQIVLNAKANNVRQIIDDAHWLSDGEYKERLLIEYFNDFKKDTQKVGTGFIVAQDDAGQRYVSNQTDILVYEPKLPEIFKDGKFVIISPSVARIAIEVKSTLNTNYKELDDAVIKFEKTQDIVKKFCIKTTPDLSTIFVCFDTQGQQTNAVINHIRNSHGIQVHDFSELEQIRETYDKKTIRYIAFVDGISDVFVYDYYKKMDPTTNIEHYLPTYKVFNCKVEDMNLSLDFLSFLILLSSFPGEGDANLGVEFMNYILIRNMHNSGHDYKRYSLLKGSVPQKIKDLFNDVEF